MKFGCDGFQTSIVEFIRNVWKTFVIILKNLMENKTQMCKNSFGSYTFETTSTIKIYNIVYMQP
jgi:hypothetical protein